MKKTISAALLFVVSLIASLSYATTLVPVQLLNPTGSSSGQAIISNGASSAPSWASVGAATLSGTTQYDVAVGASPGIGFITPGTSGGFLISNGTAAYPAFGNTVTTLTATGLITPSTTVGIKGTAAADNAQAGSVGEYQSSTSTGTSVSNDTPVNCASVSLTAGDWDVTGVTLFAPAGTTTSNLWVTGISTTSATFQTFSSGFNNASTINGISASAGASQNLIAPTTRVNVSSTTTVYLVAEVQFAVSTMTCSGFIRARRIR